MYFSLCIAVAPHVGSAYPFGGGAQDNVYEPSRPTEPEMEYTPHPQKVSPSIMVYFIQPPVIICIIICLLDRMGTENISLLT